MFSTYYLSSDKKGNRKIERTTAGGEQVGIGTGDDRILLSGGFPSSSPDSGTPLSTTLQMNHDLTALSDDQLFTLAEAELLRIQAQSYQSYQLEPDFRVCVIARDEKLLDDFVKSYGGVLEVEPLLYPTQSTLYDSGLELSFEELQDTCLVRYTRKAPVRMERCNGCGECGPACPERCISPDLVIDFSRCSLCKECEKVCDQNAIDIAGIEEITLNAPAVLLLEELNVDIPEQSRHIYQIQQLKELFATIYAAEIKEVVCHDNTLCQYSGRLGNGCRRCVDSCPHDAVNASGAGISVDHLLCEDCGRCISVCPTGAMQNGYFLDEELGKYVNALPTEAGMELILGEEQTLRDFWWQSRKTRETGKFYLEYSSQQALSFTHLLLFFSAGFSKIILLTAHRPQEESSLYREVAKVNRVAQELFSVDVVEWSSVEELNNRAVSTVPHPLKKLLQVPAGKSRRTVFATMMLHLITEADKPLLARDCGIEFAAISCDESSCTQCLACLNECKTGALLADKENLTLSYIAGQCVGCGVCVSTCPEKALTMANVEEVDAHYFEQQLLAQAEPARCQGCGKVYGSKKSLDRVLQILTARESLDTEHFHYCSECRVVKLFEAHES